MVLFRNFILSFNNTSVIGRRIVKNGYFVSGLEGQRVIAFRASKFAAEGIKRKLDDIGKGLVRYADNIYYFDASLKDRNINELKAQLFS